MSRTETVNRVLFEWDLLEPGELDELAGRLPRKLVRWLAANHPDNRTRKALFRQTGVRIGSGTVLNAGLVISDDYQPLVSIGERVAVATGVSLIAVANANNSRLHSIPEVAERFVKANPVTIEDDAWIGASAVVLPGISVGAFAVVGAGAVVTRDVPARTVVAGVPARPTRELSNTDVR